MLEGFVNKILPTDFKKDKYLWVLMFGYLLNFSIGQLDQFASLTLWVILPACLVYVIYSYFNNAFRLPIEIWLYLLFFVWLLISGILISVNQETFYLYLRRIMICVLLILAAVIAFKPSGNFGIIFLGFFLSAYFICGYSLVSGETFNIINQEDIAMEYDGELYVTADRLYGLVGNSNGLGVYVNLGYMAISYLFFQTRNTLVRLFYLSGAVLFFFTLIAAATRGGIFFGLIYISLWMFFVLRHKFRTAGLVVILLVAAFVASYLYTTYIQTTTVGYRLQKESSLKEDKRAMIMIDALTVFLEHPITGVGLAQYQFYSYDGSITHTEYLEVLTSGGLIGALIYFPIYMLLLLRLLKNRRKYPFPQIRYETDLFLCILFVIMAYGFAKEHLWDFSFILLLGAMIGYAYHLPTHLQRKLQQA